MDRLRCPKCQMKSVERRAPNIPGNVKLRKVDGVHDEYVCRNSECKWTGDEDMLGDPPTDEPKEPHKPATEW